MALLRRIEYCTPGGLNAWEDTYNKWNHVTRLHVLNKGKPDDPQLSETLYRSAGKRRASHQTSEHELEVGAGRGLPGCAV